MLDKHYPVVHSNGLNKDRLFQDSNDVTFALNAIRDNHEGGRQEYQSEPGNEISASLPSGYIILGSIYGQNEEVYIFSTNGVLSEIGLFKLDTYTTLANLSLGFSLDYPITGEYRVRNGCERTIYWCDGHNSDYWYNIDKPEEFKTLGVFDPNKFKHVPVILPIDVDLISVNDSGGILPLGSYYFQPEILDDNLNVIYSGEISPQTIVYDDNQSSNYFNIDGGLNIEQYDPAIGGVPITNKSITLQFSKLNPTFSFLRVNVFRAINGTQALDAHTVATLIPINGTSVQWTYQGYNTSAGDFPIDVSEKLVENITYQSAYVSEQVQNRYVRANLKQDSKDYSSYQQFASTVTMKWVAKETEVENAKAEGNPKNPSTYWYDRGFQGDEVYAPGIVYLHDDGVISPVFPLVARGANVSELTLLTVVPNNAVLGPNDVWLSDVEHLGLDINAQIPRWKVFNTAYVTNTDFTAHPYTYEGEFAYYESDENYPDIRDCDDNLLWGVDLNGDPITPDKKIRLIKFPDRRLISHISVDGKYTVPFGIKFDNITYPNSSVIGHKFVYADRTEFDKTVVDSGWSVTPFTNKISDPNYDTGSIILGRYNIGLISQSDKPDPYYHNFYSTNALEQLYIRYGSANIFYKKNLGSFSYYKTNRVHKFSSDLIVNGVANYNFKEFQTDKFLYSVIFNMKNETSVPPIRTNHNVVKTFFTPAGTELNTVSGFPKVYNDDYLTDSSVSKIGYGLEDTSLLLGAQTLDGIHQEPDISNFNTQFKVHNFYTYKKSNTIPYLNLLGRDFKSINYNFIISGNSDNNVFYGGDTLVVSNANVKLAFYSANPDRAYVYNAYFKHHYEEHTINVSLRHGGIENNYFIPNVNSNEYNYNKFLIGEDPNQSIRQPKGSEGYVVNNINPIEPEYYAYNKDFTVRPVEKSKVALPLQYDYCSGCSGYYPNRIVFSPKSFDEESFDMYRINKVNDYIDMPAHRGAITGLKYQNNQLLVHMEDSTFILQPNPQQISTDQNTAYLTTGDFLSVPPQELLQTDVGTGGLQSKQSMCNTPFGHCWADQKRGEIFTWSGQLDILSNKGLLQWFKENLPSELDVAFYKTYGTPFPTNSTLSLNSKGVILYYDPRFKRLMITKKEYLPISLKYTFDDFDSPNNVMYLDPDGWVTLGDGPQPVSVSDPDYFINKSWTISYEFLNQSWTSWHSYRPFYSFADSNNFYTTVYGSQIWKHLSKTKYQNFYGTKYDFIIEWQNMDSITTTVDSLHYVGYSQLWDDVNKQFKTTNTTFNKLMVYNFEQSTGLLNLQLQTSPYSNNRLGSTIRDVIKTDQNYKVSGLYDMAVNQPVITKDWNLLQLYPGYIDVVSNTTNINLTKSFYDWGNIWDKFVFVRLFYKPTEDHKKSVLLQVLNSQQSVR